MKTNILIIVAFYITTSSCQGEFLNRLSYRVLREFPHDKTAFTQALECIHGTNCEEMLESTGQYGQSSGRRVRTRTGKVRESIGLESNFFGEGDAVGKNVKRVYQLTWKERKAIIYEKKEGSDMKRIGVKKWECSEEGWGLTNNGTHLISSDGTSMLRWVDPKTMKVVMEKRIHWRDGRQTWLMNEIELVNGNIWANLFTSTEIVRIDLSTNRVSGVIDFTDLVRANSGENAENVLNGIAFNEATGTFFITGKNWLKMYEVEILSKSGNTKVEL